MNKKVDTPMGVNTFFYSLKQGIKNIKRNRMFSLASIGTIAACLFLFGIFYFVVVNFRYMIETAETSVGVTVFFDKGISEENILKIGDQLRSREEVNEVVYVSAEETWENYKEKHLSKELAETFGEDNPLADSASLSVYLNDVAKQEQLVKYIEEIVGVRQVNHSESIADTFKTFRTVASYVGAGIIIILLAVAIFLISNTVTMGIAVRKEEISIMKLIGAKRSFISAPFVVEGIIIGMIGSLLPITFLYFIYHRIISYITERYLNIFRSFSFIEVGDIFRTLIPVSLGIGIGIGFVGSYMTVRKHLKQQEKSGI